jgi:hypothetical protein
MEEQILPFMSMEIPKTTLLLIFDYFIFIKMASDIFAVPNDQIQELLINIDVIFRFFLIF